MKKKSKSHKFENKPKAVPRANPFEFHFNKVKHNILGRKATKSEFGRPTQSRHKEYDKRKATLYKEYLNRDKSGKGVLDKRLKLNGGMAARKAKLYTSFNVDDEEADLTHKNVSLNAIKLNEAYIDDDDDDDLDLLKRGDYIESAHFGGGTDGQPKTSQQFLDELIIDKRKKQLEKEENIELTAKLDDDWNTVRNLMRHKGLKNEKQDDEDDYDILLNELMFGGNDNTKPHVSSQSVNKNETTTAINLDNFLAEMFVTLTSNGDSIIAVNCIQEIMNCEVKRIKADFIERLLTYANDIEVTSPSLSALGVIAFCLTLKSLNSFATLKLIHILKALRFTNLEDISKRLFICKMLHQAHEDKYVPEIITSLSNIMLLFASKEKHRSLFIPTFAFGKLREPLFLQLTDTLNLTDLPKFNLKFIFSLNEVDQNKVKSILFVEVITLLSQIIECYSRFDSFEAIFVNIKLVLKTLCLQISSEMKALIDPVLIKLSSVPKLNYLTFPRQRPLMITMLEPKIVSNRASRNTKKILQKSYKREFKSAQRELRKDSAFMRKTILNETLQKDAKRKAKVKQLLSEIAVERSLYKKN